MFKWAHESLRVVNPTLWIPITQHNKLKIGTFLATWALTVEIPIVKQNPSAKKKELEGFFLYVMQMEMATSTGNIIIKGTSTYKYKPVF